MSKNLVIDFLYLDLSTCDRCITTDSTLQETLLELSGIFNTLGCKVEVNKVNITTRELAEQYHFLSSPTIRVNGFDICGDITVNNCCSCGAICGDDVDCRMFSYQGAIYEQPPKAMLIDGILRVLYGQLPQDETDYTLPANLERFFTGSKQISLKEGITMKKMQIFEPAMCCSTGLCGVGVDPELLRISTVLDTLKKHGVDIDRFNLNNAPMEFVNNKAVNAFLNSKGPDELPLILLDGEIVLAGRYPANSEFTQWLNLSADLLENTEKSESTTEEGGGCCCKGGCC